MSVSLRSFVVTALVATISLIALFDVKLVYARDHDPLHEGRALAFDRKKGNCLACHAIAGGVSPGNLGPPLVQMKSRFANKGAIRAKIWDATASNPETPMPPFGKHGVLSADEIDSIVDFIYTL